MMMENQKAIAGNDLNSSAPTLLMHGYILKQTLYRDLAKLELTMEFIDV